MKQEHSVTVLLKQGTRMLPKICQDILDVSHHWDNPNYPVLPWSFFFERVKEMAGKHIKDIERMIEEEVVRTAAEYLHDMGEVFVKLCHII